MNIFSILEKNKTYLFTKVIKDKDIIFKAEFIDLSEKNLFVRLYNDITNKDINDIDSINTIRSIPKDWIKNINEYNNYSIIELDYECSPIDISIEFND
jgi:hypothetical protein